MPQYCMFSITIKVTPYGHEEQLRLCAENRESWCAASQLASEVAECEVDIIATGITTAQPKVLESR
jgi:hypothetical protein